MGISAISGATNYSAATASTSTSGSSSTKVCDKKDLNKDGVVSTAEEIQYALAHPETSGESQTAASTNQRYDQQGNSTGNMSLQSTFTIYA